MIYSYLVPTDEITIGFEEWISFLSRVERYHSRGCSEPSMSSFPFATQSLDVNIFLICRQVYQESSAVFYKKTVLKLFWYNCTSLLNEAAVGGSSYARHQLRSRKIFTYKSGKKQSFPPNILGRFRHV
jgi:hypothetical protein